MEQIKSKLIEKLKAKVAILSLMSNDKYKNILDELDVEINQLEDQLNAGKPLNTVQQRLIQSEISLLRQLNQELWIGYHTIMLRKFTGPLVELMKQLNETLKFKK